MNNSSEKEYTQNQHKKSIIIIGAGPCGLMSLRYLKNNNNVLCFDSKQDIGGQWLLDSRTEQNYPNLQKNAFYRQNGCLPSSLYENMQCNLPKFLMTYKDFPMKKEYDEFMMTEQFYEYLQDYCTKYELKKCTVFNSYVSSVRLTKNLTEEEKQKAGFQITKRFLVQVTSADDYTQNIRYFQADSVLIANGHYSVPHYPKIQNIELYKGQSLHMHEFRYRTIEQYANKHLVVYGCSLSSQDIVYILLKKIPVNLQPSKITVIGSKKRVDFLKNSKPYQKELDDQRLVFISPYIKQFDSNNSLILESGERIEKIDCFLYATGYQFAFPFLDFKVDKLIEYYNQDDRCNSFGPLYKRLFCVKEPNLLFLGAIQNIVGGQQGVERQAILVSKYINGEYQLPSEEEMLKEFKKDFEDSQINYKDGREYLRLSFDKGENEITYFNKISKLINVPIDEEFNKYVIKIGIPIFVDAIVNGNYANLKSSKISDKLPSNYYPRGGYL